MHAHPENLKLLVAAVFCRAGSESEEANCLAEHLVESNLAGHDSHGVIRVVEYMGWVNDKKICPNQKLAVLEAFSTQLQSLFLKRLNSTHSRGGRRLHTTTRVFS